MGDGRIRQHSLHVFLAKGSQVSPGHGDKRHASQHAYPARVAQGQPRVSENRSQQTHKAAHGRHLDPGRHQSSHWRGRSLIGIRRPHVKGHGRDLEQHADKQEVHTNDEKRVARRLARARRDPGVRHLATCGAVDQGRTVHQEPGSERSQQQVLERALGPGGLATPTRHQQIGRQRHGFDADQQREQVRGVNHCHHARGGEEHQRMGLAVLEVVFAHERRGNQQGGERRCDQHNVEKKRHSIHNQHAGPDWFARFSPGPLAHHRGQRCQAA